MEIKESLFAQQFKSVFDELEQECLETKTKLDEASNAIRQIEAVLTECKMNLPFKWPIFDEKTTECLGYFSWQTMKNNPKRHRLHFIDNQLVSQLESQVHTGFAGEKKIEPCKPFAETNMQTRHKYYRYLLEFMKAFKEHMKEIGIMYGTN